MHSFRRYRANERPYYIAQYNEVVFGCFWWGFHCHATTLLEGTWFVSVKSRVNRESEVQVHRIKISCSRATFHLTNLTSTVAGSEKSVWPLAACAPPHHPSSAPLLGTSNCLFRSSAILSSLCASLLTPNEPIHHPIHSHTKHYQDS